MCKANLMSVSRRYQKITIELYISATVLRWHWENGLCINGTTLSMSSLPWIPHWPEGIHQWHKGQQQQPQQTHPEAACQGLVRVVRGMAGRNTRCKTTKHMIQRI